jgi:Mrp family chromosome partitioning ATPase/capsular polysaccharide biosynthesis protein
MLDRRSLPEEGILSVDLVEILRFLMRNWALIVAVTVLALLLASAYILTSEPKYTAAAQIFVNPPRERTQGLEGNLADSPLDPSVLESQVIFIQSASLLAQVAKSENLVKDPEFNPVSRPGLLTRIRQFFHPLPEKPNNELETTLYAMRRGLAVERVGKSYVLNVAVTTSSPAKSAQLANAIANAFILDRIGSWSGSSYRALRLIDPAIMPMSPSKPSKMLVIAIGLASGLVLAIGLALLRELWKPTFTGAKQIESKLGISVLSVLEDLSADPPYRLRRLVPRALGAAPTERCVDPVELVLRHPTQRFSDEIRSLRTQLRQQDGDAVPTVIHVSSTMPREGKTTISICLAASAGVAGQRAVLVDCDLRHSRLSRRHRLTDRPGVCDFVHRNTSIQTVTHYDADVGISIVPAGMGTTDPQFTLSSPHMRRLMTELRKLFDLVVIDSPALDPVLDGTLVAGLADATLLLIKWNDTPPHLVERALRRLSENTRSVAAAITLFDPLRAVHFDPTTFNFTSSKCG